MKRLKITLSLLIVSSAIAANGITLDALLQTTMEKNPEIQKARRNLEVAAGRRLVFRSVGLPDATIGAVGGDQGGHRAGEKRNQPFGFGYGGLTQPFFNAAVPASFRRGDIEILIAEQQLNVAVVEQLQAARIAFYSAIYNRSLKGVRTEQRQRLEQNAGSQKDRYESGLTDRGVFVGAEVQTRELDPRIEATQRAYDGAILKLAEAMGEDLGPSATLPEPEGELKYATIDLNLDTETTAALQGRPDLKLARLLVRAANEDQRIIEAAYYPIINAVVSAEYIPISGVRRTESTGSPRRSDDIISSEIRAGGAYTWRVVDNGKTYGAVLKQRSAREINELLLHKLEADVPREMARINHDLQAVSAKQDSLAHASSAAEENALTVQQNLAGGVVSQYEFRLAQNALLETRSGLLTLAYQQKLALAEWDRATGRYFQFSDDASQNVR
jgi:outer membrane protein TolC